MNLKGFLALAIFVFLSVLPNLLTPCTTFCFLHKGDWVYGRNYDWDIEHCLITVNKRGVSKYALTENNPLKWVSKYGSVTFNQYGREFPLGGMNEAGLVIECMWLSFTEYPHIDSRSELRELQWIQYHLDTSSTVAEVIASDKKVRISPKNNQPLHFLVCDRNQQAATIEFLNGQMKAHTKQDLPVSALTNNTYEYSKDLFKLCKGDEANSSFETANYSLKRFIWAAKGVRNWKSGATPSPVNYAFSILEKTSVNRTMFRIVYDVKSSVIHFRSKSNPAIRQINLNAFDFSCKTPVKILDITKGNQGDVTSLFSDYTFEANKELIFKSMKETSVTKNTPDSVLYMMAKFPETLKCNEDQ
jgi:choloylglycine hydrolase